MCLDNFHVDFCLYFVNLQHFDSVNEVHTTVCYLAVPPPKKKSTRDITLFTFLGEVVKHGVEPRFVFWITTFNFFLKPQK